MRVSSLVPAPTRRALRSAHRAYAFWRAMWAFLAEPAASAVIGHAVLGDLIYGWGNEGWSAKEEFLAACVRHALDTEGPILECGTGLSTVLIGAIAQLRGLTYWALEHSPFWGARTQRVLTTYHLSHVRLSIRPLKDYGEFCWYDPPFEAMPARTPLVICDGPPGDTKGGRYGLVPIMRDRLAGALILIDDAERVEDVAIARRWHEELGGTLQFRGESKPYLELTVAS